MHTYIDGIKINENKNGERIQQQNRDNEKQTEILEMKELIYQIINTV